MAKTMTQTMTKKNTDNDKEKDKDKYSAKSSAYHTGTGFPACLSYYVKEEMHSSVRGTVSQSVSLSCDGRLFLFYGPMVISIILHHDDFRAVVVIMLGS